MIFNVNPEMKEFRHTNSNRAVYFINLINFQFVDD